MIPILAPQLGISEMELADALGQYITGIPVPGGMGAIHTRGKYGVSDEQKVHLLQSEPYEYNAFGIQGLFILPSEYTKPTDEAKPSMDMEINGVVYQLTYIHEASEEMIEDPDYPGVYMVSYDHFRQHIDFLRRWLNNNLHFGAIDRRFWHTGLSSSEPVYDDEIPDVGLFHFGKFQLELRYLTPVKC